MNGNKHFAQAKSSWASKKDHIISFEFKSETTIRQRLFSNLALQLLTENEAFKLLARCGSVLMLSWIHCSTHDSKPERALPFCCCCDLAVSNLSWHTIRALFNFSCKKHDITRIHNATWNLKRKALVFLSYSYYHHLSLDKEQKLICAPVSFTSQEIKKRVIFILET